MTAYPLRSGASGPRFTGNPGDVLTLDATGERWSPQPGATAGLTAFNHRTAPDVVPTAGDYDISQIGGALATNGQIPVWNSGLGQWVPTTAAAGGVTSWNTRTGAVTFQNGDAAASQITNDSSVTGSTVKLALQALAAVTAALSIATTGPLAGGGNVQAGLTLSVATVSNTSSGVVPAIATANGALLANSGGTAASFALISDANVAATSITLSKIAQSGAATNQYPAWNGTAWAPVTPLASPANPGDNSKVPVVLAGNFVYQFVTNAQVDPAAAIAVSKLAVGTAGQALITTAGGTAAAWSNDFVAASLLTTGSFVGQSTTAFFQIGTTAAGAGQSALSGNFRLFQGATGKARTTLVTDVFIWDWGVTAADTFTLGSTVGTGALRLAANGPITMTPGAGTYTFRPARFDLTGLTGIQATQGTAAFLIEIADINSLLPVGARMTIKGQGSTFGTGSSVGGAVQLLPGVVTSGQNGNVEFFGSSGTAGDNSLAGGIYQKDRQGAPASGPLNSGFYHWSDTGGLPTWMTAAGNTLRFDVLSSTTATGGAIAPPALVVEFMTFTFKGNTRKIGLFAA